MKSEKGGNSVKENKIGKTPTLILQGSEIRVFGSKTSTTASGITAFFMQDMLKPYTSSQKAILSACLRTSLTATRLIVQISGQTARNETPNNLALSLFLTKWNFLRLNINTKSISMDYQY